MPTLARATLGGVGNSDDEDEKTDPQLSRPWWLGASELVPPPYHQDDESEALELVSVRRPVQLDE